MLEVLLAFARNLRAQGLPVSAPEVADAAKALAAVPEVMGERELFEVALAGTLVKRIGDLAVFREVFAAHFRPDDSVEDRSDHQRGHEHGEENGFAGLDVVLGAGAAADVEDERHEHGRRIDLRRFFGEGVGAPGHDHHGGDRWRLTWLGNDRVLDRASELSQDRRAEGALGLRRVATAARPGALRSGSGVELSRDIALRGGGADEADRGADELREESVAGTGRQRALAHRSRAGERIEREIDVSELRWEALSRGDLRRLERAVARMGRKLGGAPGHRGQARRGRLDGRRTARAAAKTDGLPFAPVYLARRDNRPRLVVLCDVSLSVRAAAGFLLQVARAAQRQGGRVRSFVFVREVAEVTRFLAGEELETAIAAIFAGHLLDTAEASDAGAAFKAFLTRHGNVLSRKTTVMILGDGRNNGCDPGTEVLAAIRRRCRRVVWLTPEDRGIWRLAGCDLPRYATWCDVVAPARTPAELERIVAAL